MSRIFSIALALLSALGLITGCGGGDSADNPVIPREPVIHQLTDSEYLQANPVVSPDGNWVLFESDASGNLELYRVAIDGGTPEQLTDDPAGDSYGTWSGSGAEIVFESDRSGDKLLYLLVLDNPLAEPFALTTGSGDDGSPSISKDGTTIVFESNRGKAVGSDLWTLPVGGGDMVRITESGDGVYNRTADWSPDGSQIVFESNRTGESALFILTLATGDLRQITSGTGYQGHPAWSPDGKIVAFETSIKGVSQVHIVSANGGESQVVVPQNAYWPSFLADGSGMVVSIVDDEGAGLWVVELD